MSHTYPLGRSAKDALAKATQAARTRYEAEALAPETHRVVALETEWLTPNTKQLQNYTDQASANPAKGFVQHYEDANDNPVLAVTYWKLAPAKAKTPTPKAAPDTRQKPAEDHTDDLYFKAGRTQPKRRRKLADPNQLDLFGKTETKE